MTEARLILSGLVVAAAAGLVLFGRRKSAGAMAGIAVALVVLIWIPADWRGVALGVAITVILLAGSVGWWVSLFFGVGTWLLSYVVPGSVSVLVLGIAAIVGAVQTGIAVRHLRRIARARALVPGERVAGDVEMVGTIRALEPVEVPLKKIPCALWHIEYADGKHSSALLELRGRAGSAIVDPTHLRVDLRKHVETFSDDEALKLLEAAAMAKTVLPPVPDLAWVLEGTECYVVGIPVWEVAPAAAAGGLYREAPTLPTFRGSKERPVLLADRSEDELRRDFGWTLVTSLVWGVASAAIAVAQALSIA